MVDLRVRKLVVACRCKSGPVTLRQVAQDRPVGPGRAHHDPRATASRALVFLNDGQITLALANGAQAAIVASLAAGLTIARVVTDPSWTQPRFEHVAG